MAASVSVPAVSMLPSAEINRSGCSALVNRAAPGARSVTVTVTHDPQRVSVEIADDATATAFRPGSGYGLVGMRERVEALGGKLRAGPQPGAGWAVRASLPVAARGSA